MSERVLNGFEPECVFGFFEELSAIPRGSGNETAVSEYIAGFAAARGLEYFIDKAHNVLIRGAATVGRESEPPVLLQGHIDMVCAKDPDSPHDFLRDGLELFTEKGMLGARGTTLGGDDGIACAMMLAALDGACESHPALECLFTAEEETGMNGAFSFDHSLIRSRRLINIDSDEEGTATAGCAGGVRCNISLAHDDVSNNNAVGKVITITLSGLTGGHSGVEIDRFRGNAIVILGRLLAALYESEPFRLVTVSGGAKDNAIPREASAVIFVRDPAAAKELITPLAEKYRAALPKEDRGMRLKVSKHVACETAQSFANTSKIISMMTLFPCGPTVFSRDMPGLVETSSNLGVISDSGDVFRADFLMRSSVESSLDTMATDYKRLAVLLGADASFHDRYPCWKYNPDSALRVLFTESYNSLPDKIKSASVDCTHAGLECGIFTGSIEGLDAISIGPDMADIHTPGERLDIASCDRTWRLLCEMLGRM